MFRSANSLLEQCSNGDLMEYCFNKNTMEQYHLIYKSSENGIFPMHWYFWSEFFLKRTIDNMGKDRTERQGTKSIQLYLAKAIFSHSPFKTIPKH